MRDIFWEVEVPGGRIDILVKRKKPAVDIYEVKQFGLDPYDQLDRYTGQLVNMGLAVALGSELSGWAVKYKIGRTDHVAWQDLEAGVVWYSPVPDDEKERQKYPQLDAAYRRAKRVEGSGSAGGGSIGGPLPVPISPLVPV